MHLAQDVTRGRLCPFIVHGTGRRRRRRSIIVTLVARETWARKFKSLREVLVTDWTRDNAVSQSCPCEGILSPLPLIPQVLQAFSRPTASVSPIA